jgi:outer membrane protein TolC
MKVKRYIFVVFTLTACCAIVDAAEPEVYTLKKCIETGLERNYSIRIIKNEEQISVNNATLGNAGYLPTLDMNGGLSGSVYDYGYNYINGASASEKGINSETVNAGLNFNWTIFDGFGIQADYRKLKELQKMGELNTRIAIEDLAANIAAEYYNLIRQRIRLKNLMSAVKL